MYVTDCDPIHMMQLNLLIESITRPFKPVHVHSHGLLCNEIIMFSESVGPITIMSRIMEKPAFGICENKGADQLHSNCAADQSLCFHYIDSTIFLLHKYEISSFQPSSVVVQSGLCQTWLETLKTGFILMQLIC